MAMEQMRDDPNEVKKVEELKGAAKEADARRLAQKDDDPDEVKKLEQLKNKPN